MHPSRCTITGEECLALVQEHKRPPSRAKVALVYRGLTKYKSNAPESWEVGLSTPLGEQVCLGLAIATVLRGEMPVLVCRPRMLDDLLQRAVDEWMGQPPGFRGTAKTGPF